MMSVIRHAPCLPSLSDSAAAFTKDGEIRYYQEKLRAGENALVEVGGALAKKERAAQQKEPKGCCSIL